MLLERVGSICTGLCSLAFLVNWTAKYYRFVLLRRSLIDRGGPIASWNPLRFRRQLHDLEEVATQEATYRAEGVRDFGNSIITVGGLSAIAGVVIWVIEGARGR